MGWSLASIFELTNARAGAVAVVDANGDQVTSFSSVATPPANATLTSVARSASSVTLLAANADRRRFVIHNEAGANLRIAFAATASATAFSVLIPNNNAYESPLDDYTGIITGIWQSAGSGNARITEVTV